MDHHGILLALFVLAAAANLAFRSMYVLWIGRALKCAKARRDEGTDHMERWRTFRQRAALILNGDAIAFVVASAAGYGTIAPNIPWAWFLGVGIPLTLVGLAVRLGAVRVVGARGYYWYNFFCPDRELHYSPTGIYRFLRNPMYGAGYLPVIGLPLALRSLGGLILGVTDWILVWVFYYRSERSHTVTEVVEHGSARCPGAGAAEIGRETFG